MNFKPLHDRVLVKRVASDEKTAGGIIIPDTAQEKPMEGEVLEVGSGSRNENGKLEPLDVKKGDKILFGKWSGTEVKMNGEEYLIMKDIPEHVWRDYETANKPRLVICRKDQLPQKRTWRNAWRIKEDINTLQEKVA